MGAILLRHIKALLPAGGRESLFDVDLLIEGDRIKSVGKDLNVPKGAQMIDCRHGIFG